YGLSLSCVEQKIIARNLHNSFEEILMHYYIFKFSSNTNLNWNFFTSFISYYSPSLELIEYIFIKFIFIKNLNNKNNLYK
ncbi:hypothetical protein, partial [Acinetobacter baumannii]|uniref:hypothetical protein n=1 Tax=Acinetobacter baumannii TaxID=470 RepID=UPI000B12BEC1